MRHIGREEKDSSWWQSQPLNYRIVPMLVRAVWQLKRLANSRRARRELRKPAPQNIDILGISSADFSWMTHSLFDR